MTGKCSKRRWVKYPCQVTSPRTIGRQYQEDAESLTLLVYGEQINQESKHKNGTQLGTVFLCYLWSDQFGLVELPLPPFDPPGSDCAAGGLPPVLPPSEPG